MTPDTYFTPLDGQSLLYPGQSEKYRGQCVQSVTLWARDNGASLPSYLYAYQYYDDDTPGYVKVPASFAIVAGDIIVWDKNFPPSLGAGHIDVAAADGTLKDFYAWDSNWSPPLKLNRIHHNGPDNNYIVGYLRKVNEGVPMPNDGDIINMKRAATGVPDYQPTGAEFDYYKSPEHGWKDLAYDTVEGMKVLIDQAGTAEFEPVNEELFRKTTKVKEII